MIQLNGITFRYPSGDFQLSIPDLSVAVGDKIAIIGPSGSGKTTLLNLIAGILTPDQGCVKINGLEISNQSDRTRRDFRIANVGFVFQDFGLIEYLNVSDNILHPYRITKALQLNADVKKRTLWLAEQMGLGGKLGRHPADLSHGERQRVAICRAMLSAPKVILADEATGNLDPENKLHILKLLFEAVEVQKTTLLAVTHDHDLLHHFDRVINFHDFLQGGMVDE